MLMGQGMQSTTAGECGREGLSTLP